MSSLWKGKFFENSDSENTVRNPKDLVQEQCQELSYQTDGRIIARITEYDGAVESYTSNGLLETTRRLQEVTAGVRFEVQSVLGDVSEENRIAYEFYVTSKRTPKYKFRAFLMYHNVFIYPVTFVIEEGIASEIFGANENESDGENEESGSNNYIVSVEDEQHFLALFSQIINSNRLTEVIKNLIRLNQ